jgi:O-antigen ligase
MTITPPKDNMERTERRYSDGWREFSVLLVCCGGLGIAAYRSATYLPLMAAGSILTAGLLGKTFRQRLRPMDWVLLLLLIFDGVFCCFSRYSGSGISSVKALLVASLLYFFMRMSVHTLSRFAVAAFLVASGGAVLASFALSKFNEHFQELQANGFSDALTFRYRLIAPPAPWILGEWFTFVLLTLPFALALSLCLWVGCRRSLAIFTVLVPLAIAAALLLSCSRSVFWAVVVFVVVAFATAVAYRVIPARVALAGVILSLGAIVLILLAENARYPGIAEAYLGRHTSQVRSTEGRLAIWKRSADVFKLSPIWGVGSGNAPLYLAESADEEQTTGFASRTFSLPVQILVEKGVVGAALYLAVLVLAAWDAHRKLRHPDVSQQTKSMICCLAAGVVAVLFRELTYSSLLEHAATAMLFAMTLAFLAAEEPA